MPESYNYFKEDVKEFIIDKLPLNSKILDIGPGIGTYSQLLRDVGYKMDAIEIFKPYIKKFNLEDKYDNVYHGDILDLKIKNLDYDFYILGDVLEHIKVNRAKKLINDIVNSGKHCLVAIPYSMEQGEVNGNKYETHHQPDLTKELMKKRYPKLTHLFSNPQYGYYINKELDPNRVDRAYVLHCNENYAGVAAMCAKSIKKHSDYPIIVYLVDSDKYIDVDGVSTYKWEAKVNPIHNYNVTENGNYYIDRNDSSLYDLLIQKPLIVKHALDNFARCVAYIDCDSIATKYVDNIFDYESEHPMFAEGPFDYLHINGRGGAWERSDLSTTLEHPVCEIFKIDQYRRLDKRYRNSGYFLVNTLHKKFLNEWYWMCINPTILSNPTYYCPFHEEGTLNPLLWDKHIYDGLPLIYVNIVNDKDTIDEVNKIDFDGIDQDLGSNYIHNNWFKVPGNKNRLLFYHGEKRPKVMGEMIEKLGKLN